MTNQRKVNSLFYVSILILFASAVQIESMSAIFAILYVLLLTFGLFYINRK